MEAPRDDLGSSDLVLRLLHHFYRNVSPFHRLFRDRCPGLLQDGDPSQYRSLILGMFVAAESSDALAAVVQNVTFANNGGGMSMAEAGLFPV